MTVVDDPPVTNLGWINNQDDGDFSESTVTPIDAGPAAIAISSVRVGDIDGDGDPDVAAGVSSGNLRWYENTGAGASWASAVQRECWCFSLHLPA